MTPDVLRLADEYWDHRHYADQLPALWKGDLAHLEEWEDLDDAAQATRRRTLVDFADRAERLLESSPDRTTLETIAFTARSWSEQLGWRDYIALVDHETGLHAELLTFLPRYDLVTVEHGERYLEKLHRLPAMLALLSARLRGGIATGRVAIRTAVQGTIDSIDRQLATEPEEDPLTGQRPPREVSGSEALMWRRRVEGAVADVVRPALREFRDALAADILRHARPDHEPGICHVDGGSEDYEALVRAHTSTDLSARQVHEIGLEQVARLEDEYREVAGPLFRTSDIDDIYRRLRDDEELRYRDGAALVSDATAALERATAAIGPWFGRVPRSRCIAEESRQGALAFYSRPDPDTGRPGRFFFNTSDPSAWARYQLESVTFHEGVPGHHLQVALAVEDPHLHPVHKELYIAAYGEGWALYSERLADEMGLYSSPLDRVGMLAADSMRACRLVVDTGIHALGWSRQAAIDYMLDHSPLSHRQSQGEIDRYIGNPGQALGYMIGRLEIDRIRREAERSAAFDLESFHDTVLASGSVPLDTLRRIVRESL